MGKMCYLLQVKFTEKLPYSRMNTTILLCETSRDFLNSNPNLTAHRFAPTVAAGAPLQHYQVDSVHQPLGGNKPVQ